VTDPIRERAALYALGALDTKAARAFERHLTGGCGVCRSEVDGHQATAGELALAPAPVSPPAGVRARVLAGAARAGAAAERGAWFRFTLSDEGPWDEIQPGVQRRDLIGALEGASTGYLIRVAAGAHIAAHRHAAVEHCYVVAGDLRVAGRHIHAGDYHRAARGSVHEETRTDGGCLLLIVESPA
jgi:anti-sigma factor ChrR (cupin superfamily)